MVARIAPESIGAVSPVAEYRPPAPAPVRTVEPTVESPAASARRQAYADTGKADGSVSGAAEGTVETQSPETAPVEPPTEQPGAAYVRAVLSGALSPRPTTAQELFARTGTGWVPPESEFRLADKTA